MRKSGEGSLTTGRRSRMCVLPRYGWVVCCGILCASLTEQGTVLLLLLLLLCFCAGCTAGRDGGASAGSVPQGLGCHVPAEPHWCSAHAQVQGSWCHRRHWLWHSWSSAVIPSPPPPPPLQRLAHTYNLRLCGWNRSYACYLLLCLLQKPQRLTNRRRVAGADAASHPRKHASC